MNLATQFVFFGKNHLTMKTLNLLALMAFLLVFAACSNDDDGSSSSTDDKGRVYFSPEPFIENDTLKFGVSIQFATPGGPIDVSFEIFDDGTLLESGVADLNEMEDGLGLLFAAELYEWPLAGRGLSGKTITVWLDRENERTLEGFTSEEFVNLYKRKDILIP